MPTSTDAPAVAGAPNETDPAAAFDDDALAHHGDTEIAAGLLDFAVNVRRDEPPEWLRTELVTSLADLARYPDQTEAQQAVADRHDRSPDEVLLTAGAAEAFVLLARALRPRLAAIVHPQFTEAEAALRNAGHRIVRVLLAAETGFRLDPVLVPDTADLVMVGNPTNPTSVLHPAGVLRALARPGRTLVVDEAFMDCVSGEQHSLAAKQHEPVRGLVVIRSLTKTWALAGLRIGYVLGDPGLLTQLRRAQPLWPVSGPALVAARACSSVRARVEAEQAARATTEDRDYLLAALRRLGVGAVEPAEAPFVLAEFADGNTVRAALRERGIAVRRGDTFPGLGPTWLRIAVRPPQLTDLLSTALEDVLATTPRPRRKVSG